MSSFSFLHAADLHLDSPLRGLDPEAPAERIRRAAGAGRRPAALTAYVRGLGDRVTRFDRTELALNDRSGVLDTTTPRAMVGTARSVLLGTVLSLHARGLLEGWMVACQTGRERLRASFPPSWTTADKTGTGDGECNDYALVRRPGRAPLVMAAYHDAPGMAVGRQEATLRGVGSAIVAWAG